MTLHPLHLVLGVLDGHSVSNVKAGFWLVDYFVGFLREREKKKLPYPPQPAPMPSGALEKLSGKESFWAFSSKPNDVLECGVQSARCWRNGCKASPYLAQWLRSLHSVLKCSCFSAPVLPENRLCVSCYLTKEWLHCPLLKKTQGSWVLVSLTFKEHSAQKIWCLKVGHIVN